MRGKPFRHHSYFSDIAVGTITGSVRSVTSWRCARRLITSPVSPFAIPHCRKRTRGSAWIFARSRNSSSCSKNPASPRSRSAKARSRCASAAIRRAAARRARSCTTRRRRWRTAGRRAGAAPLPQLPRPQRRLPPQGRSHRHGADGRHVLFRRHAGRQGVRRHRQRSERRRHAVHHRSHEDDEPDRIRQGRPRHRGAGEERRPVEFGQPLFIIE